MEFSNDLTKTKKATQLIFLVCGLGVASWAPMVPYAKDRLGMNEAELGVLLLFLGAGGLLIMPVTGILVNRFGTRVIILGAAMVMLITLPLLLILSSAITMAIALFLFGMGLGAVDVAMNSHGIQVQNLYGRPIMSSLHGLYSIGGIFGPLGLGLLVSAGLNPVAAATTISIVLALIVLSQYQRLFDYRTERGIIVKFSAVADRADHGRRYQWLNGTVIFLGFLCFGAFLAEGAMLDWSAIFLRDTKNITPEFSGIAYAAFSIAMAAVRMLGDGLVERWSHKTLVVGGGLLAAAGLFMAIVSPWIPLVLFGFVLLGIGAANMVPIFFSDGGRVKGVPSTVSIPAITTLGYAGQLAGPAMLGFIAHSYTLSVALGCCAALLVVIATAYGVNASRRS